MKLFYGVQATGNGHITRARALAPKLREAGIDVTYQFTGRPREQLFEMEVFGDFLWRPGLTFQTRSGRVQYLQTVLRNHLPGFVRDVKQLDLSTYDAVISDFEPVTAWAARIQGIRAVGIGHQYAFGYAIPKAGADFMGQLVLRYFAPVAVGLGVHWHHFGLPLIPPIIERETEVPIRPGKIIVYLPFEDTDQVLRLLAPHDAYQFHIYSAQPTELGCPSHIEVKPLSRQGFRLDFADAAGVICNAGFELVSEALQLGKKLLVKPLHRQMEQLSNALAFDQLRLGAVMHELDAAAIERWLEHGRAVRISYPDVAGAVAAWLLRGELGIDRSWIEGLWRQVRRFEPA